MELKDLLDLEVRHHLFVHDCIHDNPNHTLLNRG